MIDAFFMGLVPPWVWSLKDGAVALWDVWPWLLAALLIGMGLGAWLGKWIVTVIVSVVVAGLVFLRRGRDDNIQTDLPDNDVRRPRIVKSRGKPAAPRGKRVFDSDTGVWKDVE